MKIIDNFELKIFSVIKHIFEKFSEWNIGIYLKRCDNIFERIGRVVLMLIVKSLQNVKFITPFYYPQLFVGIYSLCFVII